MEGREVSPDPLKVAYDPSFSLQDPTPPLQAIFENGEISQAATLQSSSEEKDKQVTDRARKGSRKICHLALLEPIETLGRDLSTSGTEDARKV